MHSFFKLPFHPLLPDDPNLRGKRLHDFLKYSSDHRKLIKNIELGNRCRFVANHVSNSNAVCGWLPEDKEKMLKTLYAALDSSGSGKSGYEPEKW